MTKQFLSASALALFLAAGVQTVEAARLTVVNGHRYPIYVSAARQGKGDKNVWHGHRRWRELNRWLDFGALHPGESRTWHVETGTWQVQASNRPNATRAEAAEVHLRSQRGKTVRFE